MKINLQYRSHTHRNVYLDYVQTDSSSSKEKMDKHKKALKKHSSKKYQSSFLRG